MPQLVFKSVKRQDVMKLSENLPYILSKLDDTPVDYFSMEYVESEYFFDGKLFCMYPIVEVIQFDRGQEIQRKTAQIIKQELEKLGYKDTEVYFTHIDRNNYY